MILLIFVLLCLLTGNAFLYYASYGIQFSTTIFFGSIYVHFILFYFFFLVYGIRIRWLIDCIINSHFNFRDILLEVKMLRRRTNNICEPIDLLLFNYYFKNLSTQTNCGSSIGQDNPHIHIAHY